MLKPLLIISLLCITLCCRAQLNPFQSIYFQNRYLANPAVAGLDKGLNFNLGYRQQWNSFPGAPKSQVLTTEYRATEKLGLGLNVTDDQSGLIRQTRAMATYAYHLPVGADNQRLNFGLSLGVNDSRLDQSKIVGDETDEQIARYNQAKPYVDGDFGVAYTSNGLFAEAVIPNLKATFFRNSIERLDVDRVTFLAALSYKLHTDNDYSNLIFEPLVAYRKVKGTGDIFDMGLNFTMINYYISLQGTYHSNQTTGIAFVFDQKAFALSFTYNLQRGFVNNYSSGAFELGLKIKLFQ